jgi:hypothetical protein
MWRIAMSDSYRDARLAEFEQDQTGGVNGWMWTTLAASAAIALGIVLLTDPRDPPVSAQDTLALRGSQVETTGAASHEADEAQDLNAEPNEAVERRWPAAMDEVRE